MNLFRKIGDNADKPPKKGDRILVRKDNDWEAMIVKGRGGKASKGKNAMYFNLRPADASQEVPLETLAEKDCGKFLDQLGWMFEGDRELPKETDNVTQVPENSESSDEVPKDTAENENPETTVVHEVNVASVPPDEWGRDDVREEKQWKESWKSGIDMKSVRPREGRTRHGEN